MAVASTQSEIFWKGKLKSGYLTLTQVCLDGLVLVSRLTSRLPIWSDSEIQLSTFNVNEKRTTFWNESPDFYNKLFVESPHQKLAGFELRRHEWKMLYRFRCPSRNGDIRTLNLAKSVAVDWPRNLNIDLWQVMNDRINLSVTLVST